MRCTLLFATAASLAPGVFAAPVLKTTNAFPAEVISRNEGNGVFTYFVRPVPGSPVIWCMSGLSGGIGISAIGVEAVTTPPGWSYEMEQDRLTLFPTNISERVCMDQVFEFGIVGSAESVAENDDGLIFGAACGSPSDRFCAAGVQRFHYLGPGLRPALKIESHGSSSVVVSWSALLAGYRLESVSAWRPTPVWSRVENPSGTNRLEVPNITPFTFFRLRRDSS